MTAGLSSCHVYRTQSWGPRSARRRWLTPTRNETHKPDSGFTPALNRLAIHMSGVRRLSVTADRQIVKKVKRSVRHFSLLLSILTFGTCDVLAQELHVIVHHDVALRSCPASECRVVAQLPILSPVHVRNRARPSKPDHEEAVWTYVDTTQGDRASGWILDDHIGYPDRFRPARKWKARRFSFCIGDYCPEFTFTTAGEFTVRYPACFDGMCPDPPGEVTCHSENEQKETVDGMIYCTSTGTLYRAGEAIRLGGLNSHEFLYFNKRNELCADMYTCLEHPETKS